jgi:hypothetical protein
MNFDFDLILTILKFCSLKIHTKNNQVNQSLKNCHGHFDADLTKAGLNMSHRGVGSNGSLLNQRQS